MRPTSHRSGGRALACMALLVLAACGAPPRPAGQAADPATSTEAPTTAAPAAGTPAGTGVPGQPAAMRDEAARGAAGSRIFIDPATGLPREPTAEELAELTRREVAARQAAKPGTTPAAPQEFRLPDGTVGMPFPEHATQPLMACRRLDGQVDEHCHLPAVPTPRGATPGKTP